MLLKKNNKSVVKYLWERIKLVVYPMCNPYMKPTFLGKNGIIVKYVF